MNTLSHHPPAGDEAISVLIIDDDPLFRRLVDFTLRTAGYRTLQAAGRAEGLGIARIERPSLILTDLTMERPNDGYAVLDTLRKEPELATTPLILMTGEDVGMRRSMELGADDFLKKPFAPEQLLSAVETQLRKRRVFEEQAGTDRVRLKRSEERLALLASAVHHSDDAIVILSAELGEAELRIVFVNPAFTRITGYGEDEAIGRTMQILEGPAPSLEHAAELRQTLGAGEVFYGEGVFRRKDGSEFYMHSHVAPIPGPDGRTTHYVAVQRDITERQLAEDQRNLMEVQLRHAQKMESIGQLAAGIAHEINTPIQYIGDNTRFLQDAFADMLGAASPFRELLQSARAGAVPAELLDRAEAALDRADMEYLEAEIPRAIAQSLDGVGRVSKIVSAMKDFSHPGGEERTPVDLVRSISSTITVARNEWKYVADMETELDPDLPPIPCHPCEINQVILNLIINATHAIEDTGRHLGGGKGLITVSAKRCGPWAEIRVGDNGAGIPMAARGRIFEPFFTTKEVGRGTGQGLAIAHSVVGKHGGTIRFTTERDVGTTFIIRLPLASDGGEREGGS